jgi:hypothetical protein
MIPKTKEPKARNLIIAPDRVEGIMEKTKGLLSRIENNLYGEKVPIVLENQGTYFNPFQASQNKKEEYLNTLDRLDVLEYDTEIVPTVKPVDNISASEDTIEREDFNIDMKDYDNFILKIEDLIITDEKTLNLFKNNLLYLEFKVPLFKLDTHDPSNPSGVYYDTFK